MIRSASVTASLMSCVTKTTVCLFWVQTPSNSEWKRLHVQASRLPNNLSINTISGSTARTRAIPKHCFILLNSSFGYASSKLSSQTRSVNP